MKAIVKTLRGNTLAVLAIVVFIFCLGSAFSRLVEIERAGSQDLTESWIWLESQAEFEAVRFADALTRYGTGDTKESHDTLIQRFNVLLGRLALFHEGPPRRWYAQAGVATEVLDGVETLAGLSSEISALRAGDSAAALRIRAAVDPLIPLLQEAATRTLHAERSRDFARQDIRHTTMIEILVYVLGIMASGTALLLRLIQTLRRTVRAERALRRATEFSERLVESSDEGIVAFDRDLICTLWNPSMNTIFDVPPSAALGRPLGEVLWLFGDANIVSKLRGAFDQWSPGGQAVITHSTPPERVIELSCSPLRRGDEVVGGIAFIRDITERCRIEEALRQSQKMEAIGQLTGGVAHDFNNLLTIILGNLALLRGKLGDRADLAALADTAEQAGQRGAALTDQLLSFSRRQHLRPEPLDLCSAMQGIDAMIRRPLGRGITLALDVIPGLPRVLADRNQLEVAVLNLVINARDAMPQGGRITIAADSADFRQTADGAEEETVSREYVKLTVSDTGIGMSAATRERIFEPFFTTKAVGKGTGLGLSQVYGFVQQSGGRISVDSREGIGTTVSLFLPVVSESPPILQGAMVSEPVGYIAT